MTDLDGSMTDRWMGVFRSVGREAIGEARYARAKAHGRRSMTMVIVGLVLFVGPAVLTAAAVWSSSSRLTAYAVLAWIVGPVLGAGPLHAGIKRIRHLRGIHQDCEVEVFTGITPARVAHAARGTEVDWTTARFVYERVITEGHRHRLVIHPETGLLLEADGVLVKEFVGGDVSITARIPNEHSENANATTRSLGILEKHELKLLSRRLTRGTWGVVLGTGSTISAVFALAWTMTSEQGTNPDVVIAVLTVCGSLLLVAAFDWWHRRRLRAKLSRDAEAGLRRTGERWLLPEAEICWEANGVPGALRLTQGGLGSEADGRDRPVMF